MRRILVSVPVLLAAVVAVVIMTGAGDDDDARNYTVVFDQAFGLVEGADFKVAGVRVGKIDSIELSEGWPPRARVVVVVEDQEVRSLRRDATCEVKPQSLIGEYFVDCAPGDGAELADGGVVPVKRTRPTIPLDVVANVMRRPYRERFRIILMTLGAALAGRPEDLGEVLERAHPGLRETSETLRILGRQDKVIERFISDSDTVVADLNRRREDIVRFIRESGETAEIAASRRDELARTFRRLPKFLSELEPTMARLGELADAQVPVLRNLDAAGADLRETFVELRPFADATKPALRSLGKLGGTGQEAIRESREEVAELRELAAGAPRLADPLRKYLESLDDRSRSIETDLRAKETAPPPPDKTAYRDGQGFTGMESLLNYFYWQTLSINGFDQVSHVLRFTGVINDCSHYAVDVKEFPKHCRSWLGPHQPGITAPDPTEDGGGQPEGGAEDGGGSPLPEVPLPGPAAPIEEVVGGLLPRPGGAGETGGAPAAPDGSKESPAGPTDGAEDMLLDYLLAP